MYRSYMPPTDGASTPNVLSIDIPFVSTQLSATYKETDDNVDTFDESIRKCRGDVETRERLAFNK